MTDLCTAVSRTVLIALMAVAAVACNRMPAKGRAAAPAASGPVVNTPARKDRILQNLYAQIPPLKRLHASLGDISRDPATGLDRVTMTLATARGPQTQKLLMTADDKALYIVMEGPLDVSKSVAALKAKAVKDTAARLSKLDALSKGLPVRGNPNAKVSIVEFSDFECPYCRRGFQAMEKVMEKYPKDVKFVFMYYPLPFHPWAKAAAVAAECAAEQSHDAFWKLHDGFFTNQDKVKPDNLIAEASAFLKGSKIDMAKWKTCAQDKSSAAHTAAAKTVESFISAGDGFGIQGTPAFFINGKFITGAVPFDELDHLIQKALHDKA